MRGDFEKANRYYEKALTLYPESLKMLANISFCHIESRKFKEAVNEIEKKLTLETPRQVLGNLFFSLALANWNIGKKEVAQYFFKKSLSQDKRYADISWLPPNHKVCLQTGKELIADLDLQKQS